MKTDEANEMLTKMPELLKKLLCQDLLDVEPLPPEVRGKGIYVFYEHNKALYVGRADNIKKRIQRHRNPGSTAAVANFAFILTRDQWNIWDGPSWCGPLPKETSNESKKAKLIKNKKETLTKKIRLTKTGLMEDEDIHHDFMCQKERIKKMKVRVIQVDDPPKQVAQAMFEIYAAKALNTRYNDFRNH